MGFEQPVPAQVRDGRGEQTHAALHQHEAHLPHRRASQHPFDIRLEQLPEGADYRRDQSGYEQSVHQNRPGKVEAERIAPEGTRRR